MDERLTATLATLRSDDSAWRDLESLCALGGRFAGTGSEGDAIRFLRSRLQEMGSPVVSLPVAYDGWERGVSTLQLEGADDIFACESLVRSPATAAEGLVAQVIDLGRGAEEDFARAADAIRGRIVLVRHEYMFSTHTVHRRHKYRWAMDRGAVGFLIASHLPGELPVTGSSGAAPGQGIPAAGISAETANALIAADAHHPSVRLRIEARDTPASTENLCLDMPGRGEGCVVLSAHIDGHHLAQSAMDNATGLAAVLAVARAMAPLCNEMERGLRVMFFNVEEWALTGSMKYVQGLDAGERDAIACVLNLDSVAGHPALTALTSGYPALGAFLTDAARSAGLALSTHEPLMANSDHYNFAVNGIPAARLVAGFDQPDSNLRYVLTPGDTLHRITREEMAIAVALTAVLAFHACDTPSLDLRRGAGGAA